MPPSGSNATPAMSPSTNPPLPESDKLPQLFLTDLRPLLSPLLFCLHTNTPKPIAPPTNPKTYQLLTRKMIKIPTIGGKTRSTAAQSGMGTLYGLYISFLCTLNHTNAPYSNNNKMA
mmetsp:Transcript_3144/g.6443  ORF Transcript_3144/g.6443 Transcript_3144/m.6443 type:complete len:117 (+) Transcript_3144:95-445(+)